MLSYTGKPSLFSGTGGSRTPSLTGKSRLLCPVELRSRSYSVTFKHGGRDSNSHHSTLEAEAFTVMRPPHGGPGTTCTYSLQIIGLLLCWLSYRSSQLRDQDSNLGFTG
jgi:hypothetical protein